jgi:tetratricopeptide (TPR) repeat protein
LAAPDFSDAYISLIESGNRTPAPNTVETLARKLGCSVHFLRYGVDEETMAGLSVQVREAQFALDGGRGDEALARFIAVAASPVLEALSAVHLPLRRTLAEGLEACGLIDEAIEQLRLAAKATHGTDWADWAGIQVYLCRCHCRKGFPNVAVEGAEHALGQLQARCWRGPEEMDSWLRVGVALLEAHEWCGDRLRARRFAGRLVRVADKGSPVMRLRVYARAAALAEAEGDHGFAVDLAARALTAAGHDDDVPPAMGGSAAVELARLLLVRARPSDALRARALLHRLELRLVGSEAGGLEVGVCVTELARAELALNHSRQAVRHARRALELLADAYAEAVANALAVLGQAHIRLEEHDEAVEVLTRCATGLERVGHRRRAAQVWYEVAEVLSRSGSDDGRQRLAYRRALTLIGLAGLPQPQSITAGESAGHGRSLGAGH